MEHSQFDTQTILVTGAATGMGRAVALDLARQGARVVLWGRRNAPLEEVASQITAEGGRAEVQSCDIASPQAIRAALDALEETCGPLHGVFANAGALGDFKPLRETTAEDFAQLVATNLIGTQQTIAQAAKRMEGGAVVINASWTAAAVMPGTGAYAATKAGLLAMMRVMAVEEGPRGIRVNAISPGVILTPMAEAVLDADLSERLAGHTPLRRNGRPQDVVSTVRWLMSPEAAFVTGQTVTVDGGFTIGGALR